MKKYFLGILAALFICNGSYAQVVKSKIPSGTIEMFDSFEHGNFWIWAGFDFEQWGDKKFSSGANISKKWASDGSHSLECVMKERTGEKTYNGTWFYDGNQNISGTRFIVMDIYNPNNCVYTLSFVIQATDNWNWDECESYKIGKGKHTVVFDVQPYQSDLSEIKRINVSLSTNQDSKDDTFVYVDNIRLVK